MRDASGVFLSAMEEPIMSESNEPQEPEPKGEPEELGESGKRALQSERQRANTAEARVRELETQIEQLGAEHQQALDAATQTATEANTTAETATTDALKYRIALEEGLPAKHVARMKGDTEEDLRTDAQELAADLVPAPTTPRPDPSQGPKGEAPKLSNADQFAEQLADF